jgi:hypothetical protein
MNRQPNPRNSNRGSTPPSVVSGLAVLRSVSLAHRRPVSAGAAGPQPQRPANDIRVHLGVHGLVGHRQRLSGLAPRPIRPRLSRCSATSSPSGPTLLANRDPAMLPPSSPWSASATTACSCTPASAVFREATSLTFAQIRSFGLVFGLGLTDDLAAM